MADFTPVQIESALRAKAERLSAADIRRVGGAREAVMKLIGEFPTKYERARLQATLLFDLIESGTAGNTNPPTDDLKFAAGALIYLGEALDIVPDDQEDGHADDAAVIALAMEKSAPQVRDFCAKTGLNSADFLDD